MVVCLWAIHALVVFPAEVAEQADNGQEDGHEVEDGGCEEARDDREVFRTEAQFGCYGAVDGDEG